jgi:hypothetical protein
MRADPRKGIHIPMQKRTNPLELKVDSKDYTPAPATQEKEEQAAAPSEVVAPSAPVAQPEQIEAVETVEQLPASQPTAPVEPTVSQPASPVEPAAELVQPVVPEPTPKVSEPAAEKNPVGAPAPDRVAPVRPGRPAPVRPVLHNSAEDRVRHGEHVADNDVALAVKFRVAGDHVERRMVLARVSKDVCKLAQALYPGQSLGSIIEGALLTRAFLQDRDAFDEAAREIIKKGGKIKC